MVDIKLNGNHDITFEDDELVLVEGKEAIAQDVLVRLQFFQGEWKLDIRIGVPYFQKILGAKPRLTLVRSIIRDAILSTPDIESVNDLIVNFTLSTRVLSVSFTAETADGVVEFNKDLII